MFFFYKLKCTFFLYLNKAPINPLLSKLTNLIDFFRSFHEPVDL